MKRKIAIIVLVCMLCLIPLISYTPVAEAATNITIDTGTTLTLNGTFKGFGVQEDANLLWLPENTDLGACRMTLIIMWCPD